MSYVSSLYHVVFSTKHRLPCITNEYREDLYRVMSSKIQECKSKAYIINGVLDHVHILLSLSPEVALSVLMRKLKSETSVWMKSCGKFPLFEGWGKEYGAFSLSATHKDAVYKYIKGQQEHHVVADMEDEFRRLIVKAGLVFYNWD